MLAHSALSATSTIRRPREQAADRGLVADKEPASRRNKYREEHVNSHPHSGVCVGGARMHSS